MPAQVYQPGPQVLTFLSAIDDTDQPYALYLPRGYDAARKYPLVISLHGSGSNHRLNLRRVFGRGNVPRETDSEATRYFPQFRDIDMIVAAPFARGSMGYRGIPEKDVYDVLADVEHRFSIDLDRVYLTGLSMGGGGTLWLGLTRPDIWAAMAPVCAAAPPGTEEFAPNALDVPVKLFHGDQDPAVAVESSRRWYRRLLELGVHAEYIEYPGVRHNAWDFAYKDAAIFDWFSQFHRDRFPARVRFLSRAYQYDAAYWVQFDGLTPGTLASIDARFTGRNRLAIETSHLEGFTLRLAGHPQFSASAPLVVEIDGHPIRHRAGSELSFERHDDTWRSGRYAPPPGGKRPGAEGPIAAAVAALHIYVYGTAGNPGPEELNRRREVAARASEWSTARQHLFLSFAVKADKDVTPGDLQDANLVLFGTRATNTLIARFAPDFPVSLNPSAADYGLLFVAPLANGHYALVDSGLPWWTGADDAHRPGYRVLGAPYQLLATFQDYILFRGSLTDVIAEGYFDPNWKLPAGAAAVLQKTGAVSIP